MHQVEGELDAAGGVGVVRAKLQEWDNRPEPEALWQFLIQRRLDQFVSGRLEGEGVLRVQVEGLADPRGAASYILR